MDALTALAETEGEQCVTVDIARWISDVIASTAHTLLGP